MIHGRAWIAALLSATALISATCLQLTGGGTDTETGGTSVYGMLVDSAGTVSINAKVRLIPALYNPLTSQEQNAIISATTDINGSYLFTVKTPGVYNIQAQSHVGNTKSLLMNISVENRNISLPPDTLHATGTIRVILPENADTGATYVYIPGTTFLGHVTAGSVVIDSVPAGFIPALYYLEDSAAQSVQVIKVGPLVSAGDTTIITFFQKWAYSQKLILNTSPTGADVAGTVVNFPVCVRLSPSYFAFNEAHPHGADMRFTNARGTPLHHEIEYWKADEGVAAVWVLVDTVRGGSTDQFITMHWGNPGASSLSSGSAVFDTANGFAAVWHLSDSAGVFRDATGNGFCGVSGTAGLTNPSPAEGIIGRSQLYNGVSSGFLVQNSGAGKLDFPFDGRYTLSAWAFFSVLDTAYHPIVCKGDDQYGLQIKDSTRWEIFVYQTDVYYCARQQAVSGFWKHVVGVRDSDKIALYIDGALASDSIIELPWPPKDTTRSVFVGAYPSRKRYWNGYLDEIRIQDRVLSRDWIKLSYMNQRREDKLVIFSNR
jgi:hypothetical protein